jgi:hypothetical protein
MHLSARRGYQWIALVLALVASIACARQRETPQGRSSEMGLQLEVVGAPLTVSADSSFVVPVRLRNAGTAAVTLMFTSSCSFTVRILTQDGRDVAQPSALCLSVIREPTLEPGEQIEESVAYTIGEPGSVRLAPGTYRVTPVLMAMSDVQVAVQTARLDVIPARQ